MTSHDLKYIPRLGLRIRDQNYMGRKLKRQQQTGLQMTIRVIKLAFKHWFK